MNVPELYRRAGEDFGRLVQGTRDDQWSNPTPCSDWSVRELVNHVVSENLWAPPLMKGSRIEDVGDRFNGDVLGDNPKNAWESAKVEAVDAVTSPGAMERTVHLSFGDVPGSEYALQLFADLLIHGWDLARGLGADDRLDPNLVTACSDWFAGVEEAYRDAGAIGERAEVSPDADLQTKLLAAFGRKG
jgi:uncharacterized protein (TIGR03086 family)